MITIATLTGAVMIALGDRYAGIMGNNAKLRMRYKAVKWMSWYGRCQYMLTIKRK